MKGLKNKLVPALFALAGLLSLVPAVVKPVIKGEPVNNVFLTIAFMFSACAVIFFAAARKSGGGPGAPSA